jgi:predicted PurR-regulated permease PerM
MSAPTQRSPLVRALLGYLIIIAVLFVLLFLLRPILLPLVLSILIAALLEPQVSRLVRVGLSDGPAIGLLLVLTLLLLAVLGYWLGPALTEQLIGLKTRLPQVLNGLDGLLPGMNHWLRSSLGGGIDLTASLQGLSAKLDAWLSGLVVVIAGGLAQGLVALLLIPIITFFLLRDYRRTRNGLISLLPNRSFEKGVLIYFQVTRQLQRYMRGVLIQSAIIAVLASIGFYAVGLEMALLFGLLCGAFNLIPYVGPLLSAIPPILLLLGAPGVEPQMVFYVIAVVLVVQAIDNLVVVPAFIASTVDLHPLLVMLGVIVAGSLFGFWGMLLGIPFMAASKILLRDLYGVTSKPVYAA